MKTALTPWLHYGNLFVAAWIPYLHPGTKLAMCHWCHVISSKALLLSCQKIYSPLWAWGKSPLQPIDQWFLTFLLLCTLETSIMKQKCPLPRYLSGSWNYKLQHNSITDCTSFQKQLLITISNLAETFSICTVYRGYYSKSLLKSLFLDLCAYPHNVLQVASRSMITPVKSHCNRPLQDAGNTH